MWPEPPQSHNTDDLSERAAVLTEELQRQRAMIAALQASEARLRAFLESASQGVVAVDASGAIVAVNSKTEEMFGYSREELLGRTLEMLLPDRLGATHTTQRAGYFANPHHRPMGIGMELLARRKQGGEFPVEVSLSYIQEPGGIIALALITDITHRKRLEEQMRQAQKLESLGVLAGGIAHDFNNLLTGIIGNGCLALEKLPPSHPSRANLTEIMAAAESAAGLTRQLLAYAGKGRYVVGRHDLSALVQDISGLIQASLPHDVRLQLELASSLPPVEADAGQLQQLILNLVSNAGEAIGAGGSGTVAIATFVQEVDETCLGTLLAAQDLAPGRYVGLEVQDAGCGMDAATLSRIFDPFFTTKFVGRGLGLAAVLGIVRGHKGALKVYSVPGAGTTFTVLLPAAEAREAQAPPQIAELFGAGLILLIDDEEIVRQTAQATLQHFGYTVLLAEDGRTAVDLLREAAGRVDAVLLDLTMPGSTAEDIFRQLRAIRPDVPILVSSGFTRQEVARRFTGLDIVGVIQKPYTARHLAARLKAVLRRRS